MIVNQPTFNHHFKRLGATLLTLIFTYITYGQDILFYHYGLEDGLSQETVRTILKDSNGFLWLGTQDGLNRFDGTSFTVYKNQKKDSLSISGNFINTLLEDNHGNIWIGTNDNGISIYDSQVNSFKKSQIKTGNCSSLSMTSEGSIIATHLTEGLFIFDNKETFTLRKITEINGEEKLTLNTSYVQDQTLYLGTQDGRLFVTNNIQDPSPRFTEFLFTSPLGSINTLHALNNKLWIGSSNGLFVLDTSTKQHHQVSITNTQKNEEINISSLDIKENTFYIGSFNGLYIAKNFNESTLSFDTISSYQGEQNAKNSITSNRVYDTYTDGNLLWIGTNNLDVASLDEPVFKNINTESHISLNNAFILSFAKNNDYLFVGTRKGINCIDTTGFVTYITQENTNNALAFDVVRAMAIDHNNYLWIATIRGVSVMDLNNFDPNIPKIIPIFHDDNNPNSLSSDATRGVFIDHHGSVWIMTYGGGVNRFIGNLKTNDIKFQHYKVNASGNSLSSNFTYNMSQDHDLSYWITSEDGLNKLQFEDLSYQNPKFTNYFHDPENPHTVSSNTTLHTWHDKDRILWVATQDGFNKHNAEDESFIRYGKEEGLTNTFVYSITEDRDNDLWLTTNGGVFRFNKLTEQFTNYNQSDGVQSSEFNLGAHFYNPETNQIYVGGINGYNIFNPRKVSQLDVPGNLTLTSLKVKGKEINPVKDSKILSKSITKTNEIILKHTDFPCYLSFSDLDLRPNKNNQFIYALNDSDWNDLSNAREIPLLDLPKGSHVLKLQGKSRNVLWQKPPLQLSIKVLPPWYKSNLAYAVYLLMFLGIVYAFYNISLQRQIAGQESKRLKELDDLKSRFITNITHEFRTPLTIILGYLNTLKQKSSGKMESQAIRTIENNGNNLLNLVNQMLDLAKLEQGQLSLNMVQNDLVVYLKYLVDGFSNVAEEKSIALHLKTDLDSLIMDFDAEKMRQIVSNLISNALKFSSEGSTIEISLQQQNQEAIIKVSDEGIGIPEDQLPFIFDRFFQVESEHHKVYQGTGIGLSLTKEMVTLMNGRIEVNSQPNIGTTFTVQIPIRNSALKKPIDFKKTKRTAVKTFIPDVSEVGVSDSINRVLIVEDNPDMSRYIASCLEKFYKLDFAKNGKEGFEKAKDTIPDVVISDVMMPVMDGLELAVKLQSHVNTNHIPIIMLTSKALQEDKLVGLSSGADAYLTKPFERDELLVRIKMLIAKRKKLQVHYSEHSLISHTDEILQSKDRNIVFLNSVTEKIQQHLDDSNFGPTELAKSLTMSDSQLYRKLKAISNLSTAIFIRKVRLEQGKKLLLTTELTVSEIAFATGFNDPNWFSKAFRETYNVSPTLFRNNNS
ncbi:ATP-binding protein [Psychroserpens sp. XS_ASV72]|uniref:hybrid sensor histidine kinase/response regulator transcription factor n=1 Tax=Psychroserpens sp. XS_ASV72 TaxID=3241293 RepID=UPI003512FF62